MKNLLLLVAASVVVFGLNAQSFSVNFQQHDFGFVPVETKDSVQLTVSNNTNAAVSINWLGGVALSPGTNGGIYVSTLPTSIPANSHVSTWVYIEPFWNIRFHESLTFSLEGEVFYVPITGKGRLSNSYYHTTNDLYGLDLFNELKRVISAGYQQKSYSAARIEMFSKIDNWKVNGRGATQDKAECVYTGRVITNYPFNTGTLVNSPYNFNTEHTFPQGHFNKALPMRSDLHHLYPTDVSENGRRGNDPFGTCGSCYEPPNSHKGAAARAVMYFIVRYQDYNNFFTTAQESTLRNWHNTYAPTTVEETRNDDIYAYQGNRNPYIDVPSFTQRMVTVEGGGAFQHPSEANVGLKDTLNFGSFLSDTTVQFMVWNDARADFTGLNPQITMTDPQNTCVFVSSNTTVPAYDSIHYSVKCTIQDSGAFTGRISFSSISKTFGIKGFNGHSEEDEGDVFVSEKAKISELKVYPNPVSHLLNIENTPTGQVRILTVEGKVVLSENVDGGDTALDVSELPSGMYVLELPNSKRTKFVKP